MPRIHALHWNELPATRHVTWRVPGPVVALWHAPIDHDACFQEAGFTDFADTDQIWHHEFDALTQRLIDELSAFGSPGRRCGEIPQRRRGLFSWIRRTWWEPSLADTVLAPALYPDFSECIVDFGDPVTACLRTADSHPIFWVGFAHKPAALVERVASGLPIVRTDLSWETLLARHACLTSDRDRSQGF